MLPIPYDMIPFLVPIGVVIVIALSVLLLVKLISGINNRIGSNEYAQHTKFETSYDFYYVVSRLGEDPKRDEIIVHSKGKNYPNCVLYIQKHNLGMRMYIKDSSDEVIEHREKVTVGEAAAKFQEFWEKPVKSSQPKIQKTRKKPPLVFK